VTVHKTRLGLLAAAFAFAVLSASASAAPYVPPGNSAATQYTEAVPTAGGPKATSKGKQGQNRSPSRVLGTRNAEKLDAQGPQGQAAAELATATAPAAIAGASSESTAAPRTGDAGEEGGRGAQGAEGGSRSGGGGGVDRTGSHTAAPQAQNPSDSSGLGEVLGQATGYSSSGQLGLLLPLIVLGAIAWSVAFAVRRRRQPTH
jgi:hypothetical protein